MFSPLWALILCLLRQEEAPHHRVYAGLISTEQKEARLRDWAHYAGWRGLGMP